MGYKLLNYLESSLSWPVATQFLLGVLTFVFLLLFYVSLGCAVRRIQKKLGEVQEKTEELLLGQQELLLSLQRFNCERPRPIYEPASSFKETVAAGQTKEPERSQEPLIFDSDIPPTEFNSDKDMVYSADERVAKQQRELAKQWEEQGAIYQRKGHRNKEK